MDKREELKNYISNFCKENKCIAEWDDNCGPCIEQVSFDWHVREMERVLKGLKINKATSLLGKWQGWNEASEYLSNKIDEALKEAVRNERENLTI